MALCFVILFDGNISIGCGRLIVGKLFGVFFFDRVFKAFDGTAQIFASVS